MELNTAEDDNDIIKQNLLKLKNKFGSGQLGGKGTVRRKKKNINHKTVKKKIKTQIDINTEKIIKRINKYILEVENTELYEQFDVWLQDYILFYLGDCSKYDLNSQNFIDLIAEDPVDFFLTNLCFYENTVQRSEDEPSYSTRLQINVDIDKFCIYFSQSGIEYMYSFFQTIENILTNKKYIEEKTNEDSNTFTTKECYNILGLNMSDDVKLNDLKLKYRKKSLELHPDKHPTEMEIYHDKFQNLNKAYKQLLATYKY